ncbi:MAG: phage holin family protein [Candidatus Contendobacter sp.]|nr:phage holin family protein [Candidatus Contendobacter sp.]
MNPTPVVEQTTGSQTAFSDLGYGASLPKEVALVWGELRGLAHDHLQLAALETQRAGESLVTMITAGMMVAGLLLSGWLGLMAAAVLALTSRNIMTSDSALLLAVAGNLLVALMLCGVIRRRSHHLRFPANTRSLQSAASELPNAENPDVH